jgi:hypothetical protein
MGDQPESINVQRRRKSSGGPSGRADAPVRREEGSQGGGLPPVRPSGGGGGLPIPSGGKLGGCGTILVLLLAVGFYLLTGGGGGETDTQPPSYDQGSGAGNGLPAETFPTNTPRPTRAPSSGQSGQTWLVMLYQDADDQILEQDIFLDLNEAERVGSSERVTIVAQIDRFRGGFRGDDDWSSTRRYLVTRDDDLNAIHSELLADLGETSMAQGETLVDFATWAIQTYPADRYVLILSDHGMGWPGGWSDPAPGSRDPGSAPLIGMLEGDHLYLSEIDQALAQIQSHTGLEKFDLLGMDACLMSQFEVYAALQPYAHYAVASEETEPALGWAYAAFLQELENNPDMSAEALAAHIVDSYIEQDERVVDDQARSEFLRQGSPMGGFFGPSEVTAAQLARQLQKNVTLTAVDLGAFPALVQSYNDFAYALQSEDQAAIASARNYSQSYTSIFGKEVPPSYIDLGHFVQLVARETGSSAMRQAAGNVMAAMNRAIVAEKHGPAKPGSTGIAIYFPNSSLYRSPYTGLQSYTKIADRFARISLWDDFLVFHYNDRSFTSEAAEPVSPGSDGPTRAPGAGQIGLSAITVSADSAAPGQPVTFSAGISGNNIGYIYLFIGLYDQQSNSILVADTDFLESAHTQELSGVFYPRWPQDSFIINYEWDPTLFSISDGTTSALALFTPENYGATAEGATYSVEGTYTFADTGEQRYARLLFQDEKLAQVYGFNGGQETGAPAEITPQAGDTFTLLRKWLELDSSGKVTRVASEPGETLSFGATPFTWEEVYAPAGNYLVGFQVADLDGNLQAAYAQVTVR